MPSMVQCIKLSPCVCSSEHHVHAQCSPYGTMHQTFPMCLLVRTLRICTMFSMVQCIRPCPCVCSSEYHVHAQCSPWYNISDLAHVSAAHQNTTNMHNVLHGTMYQTFPICLLVRTLRICTMSSMVQCIRLSQCVCSSEHHVHAKCPLWYNVSDLPQLSAHLNTTYMHNALYGTM